MLSLNDPLLVITDIDGSLLDYHTYSWQPAEAWLSKLKANNIPIIICSSKTIPEIIMLQTKLGLVGEPFIAENGAVLQFNAHWLNTKVSEASSLTGGKDYTALRTIMVRLREKQGYKFFGFGDMTENEVAQWTGLSIKEAKLAKIRQASEVFIWRDTENRFAAFAAELMMEDLNIIEGGRFYHIMSRGNNKGTAVRWMLEQCRQYDGRRWKTLGLGDGPNDQSMLDVVNYAVIIHGYSKTPVVLSSTNSYIYRTKAYGPEGWVEGLDYFIAK